MTEQTPRTGDSTTYERIERKYALPEFMLDDAIRAIQKAVPIYRYNGVSDWSNIRTTYLDTPDLQCYQEYLSRQPVRKKIRLRQYGSNHRFDDICWVELKVKNRRLSLKRRFRCGTEELAMMMQGTDIRDRIERLNPQPVDRVYEMIDQMIQGQKLVPAIQVEYARIAFQPEGRHDVRVTLDRDVRFRGPRRVHEGRLQGLVLEVKYNGKMPGWMREIREVLGLRRVKRFSKYARSIRSLTELRGLEEPLWAG